VHQVGGFQIWLHAKLLSVPTVAAFMRTNWGWPTIESIHFMGLTLLFGTIAVWDLRLLGLLKRVSIVDLHRLVPFAVLGFAINASSGSMFLMTEPNQYIYNPAFQFKLLLLAIAGLNVLVFYMTVFRRLRALAPGTEPPRTIKLFWCDLVDLLGRRNHLRKTDNVLSASCVLSERATCLYHRVHSETYRSLIRAMKGCPRAIG
jgi:hypothetical protein